MVLKDHTFHFSPFTGYNIAMFYRIISRFDSRWTAALLALILIGGIAVRFNRLTTTFPEYDSIRLISYYKVGLEKNITQTLYSSPQLDLTYTTKEGLRNLLDSPLYPLWVSRTMTNPIGQYLAFPLLMSETDDYNRKLAMGRGVSVVINAAMLGIMVWLFFLIGDGRFDRYSLIPMAMLAFSFNQTLYAHHMSSYATAVTTLAIAMTAFYQVLKKRFSITWFFVLLGGLTAFNYLILLTVPLFGILILIRRKWWSPLQWIQKFWGAVLGYGLVFLPQYILFFKPQDALRRPYPPMLESGLITYLSGMISRFLLALRSTFAFFTTWDTLNVIIVMVILVVAAFYFIRDHRELHDEKYLYLFGFLFWLEWMVLYAFQKMTVDQSRHVLLWLIPLALLLDYVLRRIKMPGVRTIAAILLILGFSLNLRVLAHHESNLDFGLINQQEEHTLLTYGRTAAPYAYYSVGSRTLFGMEDPTFLKALNKNKTLLPDRLLLVGTDMSWSKFKKQRPDLQWVVKGYTIETIQEVTTDWALTYNNQNQSTRGHNNFYLYRLVKK